VDLSGVPVAQPERAIFAPDFSVFAYVLERQIAPI
jgi:hypothetical protein